MRAFIIVSALLALATLATVQADQTAPNTKLIFVCDAGSSGTRVYGFTYTPAAVTQDGSAPVAVVPVANAAWVKKVSPGAATFASHPSDLAAYLQPLFDFAKNIAVTNNFTVSETPLFIGATAGFRLLGDVDREALIGKMRDAVSTSGFKFMPSNVRIISGTEEGLLAFLSTNFLTQRLGASTALPITSAVTAGALDMGGASLQIAFQTPKTIMMNEFTFPYRQSAVSLYSYSFLGFGQDQFDLKLNNRIVRGIASSGDAVTVVQSGCYNQGYAFNFTASNKVVYEIHGTGAINDCITLLDEMNGPSTTDCQYGDNQCSIGCAYQPTVPENVVFYATASFYYTVSGLFGPAAVAANNEISLQDIWTKTQQVCAMTYSAVPVNGNINPQRVCYQGAWFISLLHRSMGFSLTNTHMRFALQVDGKDIAWPLGMAINEVNKASFPVATCPPQQPTGPTETQTNGNVVINFANMFNGLTIGTCNK